MGIDDLDSIKGLREYIKLKQYRQALGLPDEVSEDYRLLAQGEYNRNYYFEHTISGKKLLLRINMGSQMKLKNQIEYEFNALKLLETSNRTPKPVYVDGSLENLKYGVMVMEFLPGRVLDYNTDLKRAAKCLADIHSVRLPQKNGLLKPDDLINAVLSECSQMLEVYISSSLADNKKKKLILEILKNGKNKLSNSDFKAPYKCCINTELNSTNFLINEVSEQDISYKHRDYLIDWEKPIYGEPAQDLGHFLAPTTTFWKTDVILKPSETEKFVKDYTSAVCGRFNTEGLRERVYRYIPINCLRGITWCAMAWVQYKTAQKELFNSSTAAKLDEYLDEKFLLMIKEQYIDKSL